MFSDTLNSYFGYVIFLISEQNFFTITDMQNSFFFEYQKFFLDTQNNCFGKC